MKAIIAAIEADDTATLVQLPPEMAEFFAARLKELSREVSLDNEWVPFLRTLFHKESFVAESAMQWADVAEPYPWETVQEYLQTLLSQGFLERA